MRPVPVEVVRRDVEQHADRRRQRRRQIDLERRHLDDVDSGRAPAAPAPGSPCRYCRPSARPGPAARRMWAISAVVVDLPLVPVTATTGLPGAALARSRKNSSTSPMISTPAACALRTVQCGSGCVSGTPGRQHQRRELPPVGRGQVRQRQIRPCALPSGLPRCRPSTPPPRRPPPAPRRWQCPSARARRSRPCAPQMWCSRIMARSYPPSRRHYAAHFTAGAWGQS